MGGKALKNVKCVRIDRRSYETIKNEVISKLSKYIKVESLIELPDKESFGDIDLLYEENSENVLEIVKKEFNPKDIFINGPYLSFSYYLKEDEYFQIDLIKTENIIIAKFYLSYGDLGSIIGIMVKKNNLSFGHDGLSVIYEDEKIILLEDQEKISNFLELDYKKYEEGFKTTEEIYKWVLECKFFDKEYFELKNLNSNKNHAYKIRPFFKEFCDYVKNLEIKNENIDKISVNEYINLFDKNKEKEEIDKKIEIRKLNQEKYSGLIFMEFLDNKKNINKYKQEFKEKISLNYNFNEWLKNNEIEYIKLKIKEFIIDKQS
jgi:hypothetical protein